MKHLTLTCLLVVSIQAQASVTGTLCCTGGIPSGPIPLTFEYAGLESSGVPNLKIGVIGTIFIDPSVYETIGEIVVDSATTVYTDFETLPDGLNAPSPSLLEATLTVDGADDIVIPEFHVKNLLISELVVPGILFLSASEGVVALGASITVVPLGIPAYYLLTALTLIRVKRTRS